MKKIRKKVISPDAIARLGDKGENVNGFFQVPGRMVRSVHRVNVDLTASMIEELDTAAKDLNVSRQAVIKTLVRQALDQRYLAAQSRSRLFRRSDK